MAKFLKTKLSLALLPILVVVIATGCSSPTSETTLVPDHSPEYAAALEQLPITFCPEPFAPRCFMFDFDDISSSSNNGDLTAVLCSTPFDPYGCLRVDESSPTKFVDDDGLPVIVDEAYCRFRPIRRVLLHQPIVATCIERDGEYLLVHVDSPLLDEYPAYPPKDG